MYYSILTKTPEYFIFVSTSWPFATVSAFVQIMVNFTFLTASQNREGGTGSAKLLSQAFHEHGKVIRKPSENLWMGSRISRGKRFPSLWLPCTATISYHSNMTVEILM